MSYKIVVDSCCELPENLKKDPRFQIVPLGLEVGDYRIMDDENFNQAEFIRKVAECPECPRSSCPSPEKYMNAYQTDAEHVYVVTLSANLSGSHNSALLGKSLYEEHYGEKKIHVVDSRSASGGETQIALKAMELEEQGLPFDEIVEKLESFRNRMETFFVLDNLETLRKNGRLSGVKALVATSLNIKPVMGATREGTIEQLGQAIGMKKALLKISEILAKRVSDAQERRLIITHCNAPARAETLKKMILDKVSVKDVLVMDTAGISSMYANDGGVIVTI
ncbi:MAG: DegV family protein [Lachnospiraceae bacterium]|nr:DegV family protein [Lachnospiraceae bacterium]